MNPFVQLFFDLDSTNSTRAKLEAMTQYFRETAETDGLWLPALLLKKTFHKKISSRILKEAAIEMSQLSPWLFQESYQVVGDLAETIALVFKPEKGLVSEGRLSDWMDTISRLGNQNEAEKKEEIKQIWGVLSPQECLVFNKLITGGFRFGVSQNLLVRAIAAAYELDPAKVAHRLMGDWTPHTTDWQQLLFAENHSDELSKPYPFLLSHALEKDELPGDCHQFHAEWKWDGIRVQVIVRGGAWYLWSRGEEIIQDSFPELGQLVEIIPDGTVLDAELLAWQDDQPMDFSYLQTRISRKKPSLKIQKETPVILMAFDLLEWGGKDIREETLARRREILENLVMNMNHPLLKISTRLTFSDWKDLSEKQANARQFKAEGLMLKRLESTYRAGRKRGDWWKWKVDPFTIDAVLLYAQFGHGRRADLFTDYTFAVWDGDRLATFAKAYSGLSNEEIRQVDAFIKKNTLEKFGPVRTVKPELVFEIAFEGIQFSSRHKSGVAVRFPRILRWRKDKKPTDADHIEQLRMLIAQMGSAVKKTDPE